MQSGTGVSLWRVRWSVGSAFFLQGFCFSTWTSRIPSIQAKLALSHAALGSMLFVISLASIICSFVSPRIIKRFGMQRTLAVALVIYSLLFIAVGLCATPVQLALCLFGVGCLSNIVNVSVNTQSIRLEAILQQPVTAFYHGIWGAAGFLASSLGAAVIGFSVSPAVHFGFVAALVLALVIANAEGYLTEAAGCEQRSSRLTWPSAKLLAISVIAFFVMSCEGAMFDWGGVYFQSVIHADHRWTGVGTSAFIGTLAVSRFFDDRLAKAFGRRRMITVSGLLILIGLLIAVAQPSVLTGVIGYVLIGAGSSAVLPLVLSQAGRDPTLAPSVAIASISAVGVVGFLIGPPLIGWIAGVAGLRLAFMLIAVMGVGIVIAGRRQFPVCAPVEDERTQLRLTPATTSV